MAVLGLVREQTVYLLFAFVHIFVHLFIYYSTGRGISQSEWMSNLV